MSHLQFKISSFFLVLFCVIITTPSARASGEFSGHVGIVSDYVLRGISQSDESAALQASLKWQHDSGFYLKIGGSTVDYVDAELELDFYAGYNDTYDQWFYDIYLIYFHYPGADSSLDYDFFRVDGTLGYNFEGFSIFTYHAYTPEYFANTGQYYYPKLGVTVPLPYDLSFTPYVAHAFIDEEQKLGIPDYTEWGASLTYSYDDHVSFTTSISDTDLSRSECADGCGAQLVFGLSYSF